jgi:hypothetical protein
MLLGNHLYLILPLLEYCYFSVPVVGQAKGFIDVAKNVTNATDVEGPVVSGIRIISDLLNSLGNGSFYWAIYRSVWSLFGNIRFFQK